MRPFLGLDYIISSKAQRRPGLFSHISEPLLPLPHGWDSCALLLGGRREWWGASSVGICCPQSLGSSLFWESQGAFGRELSTEVGWVKASLVGTNNLIQWEVFFKTDLQRYVYITLHTIYKVIFNAYPIKYKVIYL